MLVPICRLTRHGCLVLLSLNGVNPMQLHGLHYYEAYNIRYNMMIQDKIINASEVATSGGFSPWLNTPSAAEYLGFTDNTLRVWRHEGRGPNYYKVGRHVRYHRDALDAFVRGEVAR